MLIRRRKTLLKVLLLVVIVLAATPLTQAAATVDGFGGGERIVISGPVVVSEEETVGDVVVLRGSATIQGRVQGDVFVFDGPVDVSGEVEGDLVALRGPVNLADTAEINGDALVRGDLNRAPGATIAGQTKEGDFTGFPSQFAFFGRMAAWLAFTATLAVVGLLILLLGPRLTNALANTGLGRTAPALGWGLVAFFAIPILTLVSFLTIIGIPLGIMMLFGMLFIFPVAYSTTALVAGRRIVREPGKRILSFFAGLAMLRVLALVPFVGGATWFLATAFGLGVMVLAIARARTAPAETGPPVTTPAPA